MIKLKEHSYKYIFLFLLSCSTLVLFLVANGLSISYKEYLLIYEETSLLSYFMKSFLYLFGENNIALRTPFILLYVGSILLTYLLTKDYYKRLNDKLLAVTIFMFLPGVIGASLVVNSAMVVIFSTLGYLYYYKVKKVHNYVFLVFFLFLDNSFAILYLALFLYSLDKKNKVLLMVSSVLFILSMSIYGFDTGGKPESRFLDTFAIYASIFSPFLFIYFFYSQYRIAIRWKRSIYWYIPFTALIFSLLLSLRQKILIEDFAPYVVIAIPIMLKLFLHTLRIRLPEFRKNQYILAVLIMIFLSANYVLIVFNKPLYLFLEKPKQHFAYNYHFISDLADKLKEKGVDNINSKDIKLLKRLKFYGLKEGNSYEISRRKIKGYTKTVYVNYYGKRIITYYLK